MTSPQAVQAQECSVRGIDSAVDVSAPALHSVFARNFKWTCQESSTVLHFPVSLHSKCA